MLDDGDRVIDVIRVQPCAPLQKTPQLRLDLAHETACPRCTRPFGPRNENARDPAIIATLLATVALELQAVVFPQRLVDLAQRLDHHDHPRAAAVGLVVDTAMGVLGELA